MVSFLVVDDTQVDVSKEFSSYIGNLLVACVELDCLVVILWILLAEFHVVYSHAIICKSFSVYISNGLANLQELLVLINSHLELSKVIIENSCGIVGTPLVS